MNHSDHDMSGMIMSTASSIVSSTMSSLASATAIPSSHAGHDIMADASTTTTNEMNMSMSMGIFHWSGSSDGIWLDSWVPNSEAAYIGACLGLFFFSILSRGLPALEVYFMRWRFIRDNKIQTNILTSKPFIRNDVEKSQQRQQRDDTSSQSFNPSAYPDPLRVPTVPPFSWSTDTIRSFLSTVTSFVSYLLMMVVMTGNGGFFLVIMVGIFFGEMAFGRFKSIAAFANDHVH